MNVGPNVAALQKTLDAIARCEAIPPAERQFTDYPTLTLEWGRAITEIVLHLAGQAS